MKYCRLCATEKDDVVAIFKEEELSENIHRYLQILVMEEDLLPHDVCLFCCDQVKQLTEFITRSQLAQRKLYELLSIEKTKKISKPVDVIGPKIKVEELQDSPVDIPMDTTDIVKNDLEPKKLEKVEVPVEYPDDCCDFKENDDFSVTFTLTIPELPCSIGEPNSSITVKKVSSQLSLILRSGEFNLKELGKEIYRKYSNRLLQNNHIEMTAEELIEIEPKLRRLVEASPHETDSITDDIYKNISEENKVSHQSLEEVVSSQPQYRLKIPSIVLTHVKPMNNINTTKTQLPKTDLYTTSTDSTSTVREEFTQIEPPDTPANSLRVQLSRIDPATNETNNTSAIRAQLAKIESTLSTTNTSSAIRAELARIDSAINSLNNDTNKTPTLVTKILTCSVKRCTYITTQNYRLQQHVREVHLKPIICDICGKRESKKSRMLQHIRNKHMEKKLYECETCTTKYTSKKWYELHKNRPCPGMGVFPYI